MSDKLRLAEFSLSEGVEFEDGLLRNVPVLGPKSANNREYSDDAQRSLVPLLEGMRVYADHAGKGVQTRSIGDRLGHLENIRFVEAEHRTRADLRFLTTHPKAVTIKEAYQGKRPYFGLSIRADGEGLIDKTTGRQHVQRITKVYSCDVVDEAATCHLSEQDSPDEPPPPMDPAAHAQEGMVSMVTSIVLGDGTPEEKAKKIQALLEAMEGDGGSAPAPAEPAPSDAAAPPMSEQRLQKVVGTLVEQAVAKALTTALPTLVEQEVQRRAAQAVYVKPTTPAPAPPPKPAAEKKDEPPSDPAKRKAWLRQP